MKGAVNINVRKLSIVIPAYNEEATIREVIERVRQTPLPGLEREIIAVDDGSTDWTAAILQGLPGIKALFHASNRGKGAALKTGFAAATGEILLIQDADLEYSPSDYAALLRPILDDRTDVVMGSRFASERPTFFWGKSRSPFFSHYIGNLAITGLTNLLYGHNATDYYGGYKVFKKSVIDSITVDSDGFNYDNELLCKILRREWRIMEVPIAYVPRSYAEGKKITWKDGVGILWSIVKSRFD